LNAQFDVDNIHFDHLTIEEGLTHNSVNALLQDHNGYIWIGTEYGLNRYDAFDLKTYGTNAIGEPIDGFVGKAITALFEDSEGNLWVGTKKNSINFKSAHNQKFQNFSDHSFFSLLNGKSISSFYEDANKTIWVSSNGAGLLSYNLKTQKTNHFTLENSGLTNNIIFEVVADKNENIWIAAAGLGIHLLDTLGKIELKYKDVKGGIGGYRKSLLLDTNRLWIGTDNSGLYALDFKTGQIDKFDVDSKPLALSSNSVRALSKIEDNLIFVGTDGGGVNIINLDNRTNSIYQSDLKDPSALNSNAIISVAKDKDENIWIGTFNGGINILKSTKIWFDVLNKSNSNLKNQSVLSIIQSKNGDLYLTTDGGGIYILDVKSLEIKAHLEHAEEVENSLCGNVVKTVMEASDGKIWIGTFRTGMDIYDPIKKSFTHFTTQTGNNIFATNNIWSIVERPNGEIWIGTLGGGIYITDSDHESFRRISSDPNDPYGLSSETVLVLFEDHNGSMWVGTEDGGLGKWDDQYQHFDNFKYDKEDSTSISSNEIRSIFEDSNQRLWIGTENGGLNLWNNKGSFKRITQKDGLLSNGVMGITEDQKQFLWLSSYRGISKLNPTTMEIVNFDFHASGMNNQFNQMSIHSDQDGKLFFGGINGLHILKNPSQVQNMSFNIGKPVFTSLKVLNEEVNFEVNNRILKKPIEQAESIYLDYSDKSFTLEFSAFDYANQFGSAFNYYLEGFDTEWQETRKKDNSVTYTNLDAGRYVLHVNYEGHETQVNIFVKPPFWKSWWFLLGSAVLIIALLSFVAKYFISKREASFQRQILLKERQILELENKNLEKNVDMSNSKLLSSTAQMVRKNEFLNDIKADLDDQFKDKKPSAARSIIRKIERELENEDYWAAFNLYFDKVDKDFVKSILDRHPNLTQNDIRTCAMIRINLSTKEIASIMNISVRGVEKSRYRLKKRLELEQDQSLTNYIRNFKMD